MGGVNGVTAMTMKTALYTEGYKKSIYNVLLNI
jgi:hypothetical protein